MVSGMAKSFSRMYTSPTCRAMSRTRPPPKPVMIAMPAAPTMSSLCDEADMPPLTPPTMTASSSSHSGTNTLAALGATPVTMSTVGMGPPFLTLPNSIVKGCRRGHSGMGDSLPCGRAMARPSGRDRTVGPVTLSGSNPPSSALKAKSPLAGAFPFRAEEEGCPRPRLRRARTAPGLRPSARDMPEGMSRPPGFESLLPSKKPPCGGFCSLAEEEGFEPS